MVKLANGKIIDLTEENAIDAFRELLMIMQRDLVEYASDEYYSKLAELAFLNGENEDDMEQGTYKLDFAAFYAAHRILALDNLTLENPPAGY